jgi:copper chaperone
MTLQFKVPKLICSVYARSIAEAIKKLDANATVDANPETKLVNVETERLKQLLRRRLHWQVPAT